MVFALNYAKTPTHRKKIEMKDYKKYIDKHFQKGQCIYCGKLILQPWQKLMTNPADKTSSNPLGEMIIIV